MRALNDLQEFYLKTLRPDLQVLEDRRKKIVGKLTMIGIPILLIIVATAFFLYVNRGEIQLTLIPGIPGIIIIAVTYHVLTKSYKSDFKSQIISRLVHFIDESLTYQSYQHISLQDFKSARIFRHRVDRYRGDDMVYGTVGATKILFSEIHAEYKTETRDSKGRKQTHWHTIFKGLFFMGDFNKHIQGETFVLPDTAERLFGRLGKKMQSWSKSRGQLVHLEDPEFEENFAVYSDDQVQARYILSTSLMRRILEFKKQSNRQLHMSFLGTKVYIAISFTKNLFEPRLFRTLLDFDPIREYFEDMHLAYSIVEALNLNTRIWTKK